MGRDFLKLGFGKCIICRNGRCMFWNVSCVLCALVFLLCCIKVCGGVKFILALVVWLFCICVLHVSGWVGECPGWVALKLRFNGMFCGAYVGDVSMACVVSWFHLWVCGLF